MWLTTPHREHCEVHLIRLAARPVQPQSEGPSVCTLHTMQMEAKLRGKRLAGQTTVTTHKTVTAA